MRHSQELDTREDAPCDELEQWLVVVEGDPLYGSSGRYPRVDKAEAAPLERLWPVPKRLPQPLKWDLLKKLVASKTGHPGEVTVSGVVDTTITLGLV